MKLFFIYLYIRFVDVTNCLASFKCSQIIQQDSRVFELMTLAQDMGMDKLKMECEDHVIATMKG